ncbi:hypothetical protein LJR034_008955 [Caballeronia sp. LjRoot34]|uniref:hypothetical protein n=1 Tax=Caballeronia sp. LjRoot34 TaxID=3342325 RepID=UPI003ED0EA75
MSTQDLHEYELITKAWRRLAIPHCDIIKMVYVGRAHREIVCRRLRLARSHTSIYDLALAAARRALIGEIRQQLADARDLEVRQSICVASFGFMPPFVGPSLTPVAMFSSLAANGGRNGCY